MIRRFFLWRRPCSIGAGIRVTRKKMSRCTRKQAELDDFTRVALPQGLVASGFFANVVLLSFDEALRVAIGDRDRPRDPAGGFVPVRRRLADPGCACPELGWLVE